MAAGWRNWKRLGQRENEHRVETCMSKDGDEKKKNNPISSSNELKRLRHGSKEPLSRNSPDGKSKAGRAPKDRKSAAGGGEKSNKPTRANKGKPSAGGDKARTPSMVGKTSPADAKSASSGAAYSRSAHGRNAALPKSDRKPQHWTKVRHAVRSGTSADRISGQIPSEAADRAKGAGRVPRWEMRGDVGGDKLPAAKVPKPGPTGPSKSSRGGGTVSDKTRSADKPGTTTGSGPGKSMLKPGGRG
jgi:hypothetical protein